MEKYTFTRVSLLSVLAIFSMPKSILSVNQFLIFLHDKVLQSFHFHTVRIKKKILFLLHKLKIFKFLVLRNCWMASNTFHKVFCHKHLRFTGPQEKKGAISITPLYLIHSLDRHLDISRAITAEISPLQRASIRILAGNLWFPSTSR